MPITRRWLNRFLGEMPGAMSAAPLHLSQDLQMLRKPATHWNAQSGLAANKYSACVGYDPPVGGFNPGDLLLACPRDNPLNVVIAPVGALDANYFFAPGVWTLDWWCAAVATFGVAACLELRIFPRGTVDTAKFPGGGLQSGCVIRPAPAAAGVGCQRHMFMCEVPWMADVQVGPLAIPDASTFTLGINFEPKVLFDQFGNAL